MKQGLFEVFGEGSLGLKAEDLNQYSEAVTGSGMTIPEGIVIATGIFGWLTEDFDLREGVLSGDMEKRGCPPFLLSVNEEILDRLETGKPYAIRSSALSERGGTGIYASTFFWPTGNKDDDLQGLWHCECLVYASEFTPDARLWRERVNSPIGMAILIQPIIGFQFDKYFLPPMAGTAYTSFQGLPTVRAVLGLGTKAVNGEGKVYNVPSDHILHLQRDMWDQEEADVLTSDGICQIPTQLEEVHGELGWCFTAFNKLFECLAELQKHGNFYLEWIIYRGTIFVVQCATYEDRLPGDLSFDSSEYFALLEGKDVLHSGRATCKCVVYVGAWSTKIAHLLEDLNENVRDHLLIVPQDATSQLANHMTNEQGWTEDARLGFRHFSNALAVIERQHCYTEHQRENMRLSGHYRADHTSNRGASHFSQLCGRTNILFIGAEFDETPLIALPGTIKYRGNNDLAIWETSAEVVADTSKKSGFVYISKQTKGKKNTFPQSLVQGLSDDLRRAANRAGNNGMSGHLFNLSYAIGPDTGPIGYDQFELDQQYLALEDVGGVPGIIESLKAVIADGERYVDPDVWDDGLKDYLEQLLAHLVK